jgi:hypothetical protein
MYCSLKIKQDKYKLGFEDKWRVNQYILKILPLFKARTCKELEGPCSFEKLSQKDTQ